MGLSVDREQARKVIRRYEVLLFFGLGGLCFVFHSFPMPMGAAAGADYLVAIDEACEEEVAQHLYP